jgi:hypothetical protein
MSVKFNEAMSQLTGATVYFGKKAMSGEALIPVLSASPYQELFGDVVVGYMLLRQADIADRKLQEIFQKAGADTREKQYELLVNNEEAAFYSGKIASTEFFSNTGLSLAAGKA